MITKASQDMNISKNLTGMKFGRLTVISKAPSILGGKTVKRYWGAWNCKCDCGNLLIVKTTHLNKKQVRSCGCLVSQYGLSLKPGQKINRLTTISYKRGKWFCYCDCGNYIEISTDNLTSGNTKSCGCLKSEVSSKNSDKLIAGRRQYDPKTSSARRVWKSYCYRDIFCDLSFAEFLKISQQNCFYCGISPNIEYNFFKTVSSRGSEKAKLEGTFIYNGLDRIDSLKNHTLNNVVPCCYECNRAKNNRSVNDFLIWINSLKVNEFNIPQIISKSLPEKGSLLTSIKCIYKPGYNDGDLTLEEFYYLSQLPCFYCGAMTSNIFNKAKIDKKASQNAKDSGDFIYNGLDRIDPQLNHIHDNVVPCCKYCNFAKSNLSLIKFNEWIGRIQGFQKTKNPENSGFLLGVF